MSADLPLEALTTYARTTQAETRQDIAMKGIKAQAQGEAAMASILLEQAAQLAAVGYDQRGRTVTGDQPSLDARL